MKLASFKFIFFTFFLTLACLCFPTSKRNGLTTSDKASGIGVNTKGNPFALFLPKVFLVTTFTQEREAWTSKLAFTNNLTIPGLSPLYPEITCLSDYSVCLVTTGEGEINAAATVSSLTLSPYFDLSKTYWLITGIGGGTPDLTTIGSAVFSKYAVQGGLESQIDWREVKQTNPAWNTSYFGLHSDDPWSYPGTAYGTEVFELNQKLRDRAAALASNVTLDKGNSLNAQLREQYSQIKARNPPKVEKCAVMTSDVYYSGRLLTSYFSNFTSLITNSSATLCASAQEDNALLESFLRVTKHGLIDFLRIVDLRTISDFLIPPPSLSNDTIKFFTNTSTGGTQLAFSNLYNAGYPFVKDVLENWNSTYSSGEKYKPTNYIGDIFGSLGEKPNFGRSDFVIA